MADHRQLHVVMFTWLTQGHITTPFLELAKTLLTHGLRISFVSTPLNIACIRIQIIAMPGNESLELSLPSADGLPVGIEYAAVISKQEKWQTTSFISEELKMGMEVTRNDEDVSFIKEVITRAVRAVMVEEEGNRIRSNVEEISQVLTSNDCQVHRTNMHNFVTSLKEKASTKQL